MQGELASISLLKKSKALKHLTRSRDDVRGTMLQRNILGEENSHKTGREWKRKQEKTEEGSSWPEGNWRSTQK